jgi:hypothetical protein
MTQRLQIGADIQGAVGGSPSFGNSGAQVRVEFVVDYATIQFHEPFCPRHNKGLRYEGGVCDECLAEIKSTVEEHLKSTIGLIPCNFLRHDHNCECYRGHVCEPGCISYPVPKNGHPLEELASAGLMPAFEALKSEVEILRAELRGLREAGRRDQGE